jgi:uncharacterized membrane protein
MVRERGYSMAWWAVILATVFVPLLALSIDITRLLYVRVRVQAASDAACEAAANTADIPAWREAGIRRIDPGKAAANAAYAFYRTVAEAGIVRYSPTLSRLEIAGDTARCRAEAIVQSFILPIPLRAWAESEAQMRYR